MAEIVKKYQFKRERGVNYPWAEWLDGKVRRFRKGSDFMCSAHVFCTNSYLAAKRRGLKARLSIENDNTVMLQAYKPTK